MYVCVYAYVYVLVGTREIERQRMMYVAEDFEWELVG